MAPIFKMAAAEFSCWKSRVHMDFLRSLALVCGMTHQKDDSYKKHIGSVMRPREVWQRSDFNDKPTATHQLWAAATDL